MKTQKARRPRKEAAAAASCSALGNSKLTCGDGIIGTAQRATGLKGGRVRWSAQRSAATDHLGLALVVASRR